MIKYMMILVVLGVLCVSLAEETMNRENKNDSIIFPNVSGSNLHGQKFNLPRDFEGELNIVLVAFWREQQRDINTWLPTAKRLAEQFQNVAFYELPTIRKMNVLSQWTINNGMRMGIPDSVARHTTITLYIDKEKFTRSLGIDSQETIHSFLVRKDGVVLWHERGVFSIKKEEGLLQAIEQNLPDLESDS